MAENKPITRPLPRADEPDTAPFWAGTKVKEFRYQACRNCGTVVWHPRAHCTGCLDGDLEWRVSKGRGAVYSFSVVRQSYHPFFRGQVPYAVAYVDLDEGPRFLTNVVGVDDPPEFVRMVPSDGGIGVFNRVPRPRMRRLLRHRWQLRYWDIGSESRFANVLPLEPCYPGARSRA